MKKDPMKWRIYVESTRYLEVKKHPAWEGGFVERRRSAQSWMWRSAMCKDHTSKDPFSRCAICKNLAYSLNWRWQDKVGLQYQEEKNFALGIAYAWWNWTVRRPTPMTTWQPRSRVTSTQSTWNPTTTWHTWWTREHARSVSFLSSCSVWVVTLILCTHRVAQDVRVFVSFHPCMKWASLSSTWNSPSTSTSFSHSSSTSSSSWYTSTSTRSSGKIPCALRQGDGVNWRVLLQHTVIKDVTALKLWSNLCIEAKHFLGFELWTELTNTEPKRQNKFSLQALSTGKPLAKPKPRPKPTWALTPVSIPYHERKWIDVEPGKFSHDCVEVSKFMIRFQRHDDTVHREHDGAVRFDHLAEVFKSQ